MFNYFVGMDIGKTQLSIAILDRNGKIKQQFEAQMNKKGCENLLDTLNSLCEPKDILIGMESCGPYHLNLFYFLTSRGFTVILINPIIVKQFN